MIGLVLALVLGLTSGDDSEALTRARAHLAADEAEAAIAILQPITAREPAPALAWHLLGRAQHAVGNYEEALPAHERAARSRKFAAASSYLAARAHARLGNAREA